MHWTLCCAAVTNANGRLPASEKRQSPGGSAEALVALGQEHHWGYTLDQDFVLAFDHSCSGLRKHMIEGAPLSIEANILACKLVASCYAEGLANTRLDYPKALEWWTIAANLGDRDSMIA